MRLIAHIIYFFLLLSLPFYVCAQSLTIIGKLSDSKTNETIVGAAILEAHSNKVVVSNSNGVFTITVPKYASVLRVSCIGYNDTLVHAFANNDTLYLKLRSKVNELSEVTITATDARQQRQTGFVALNLKDVKGLATLFGSSDPLKILQLKPGFALANEGDGGLYVRGGDNGHNLVLLNDIPLHNPTHLMGFYSVFHESATRSISMYKSAPPARFGGKLSSVIDVTLNNSSDSLMQGDVSTGLLASSLTLKGSFAKRKVFYLFSARQAYLGFIRTLIKPLNSSSNSLLNNTAYSFSDYYTLFRIQTSSKSILTLSGYLGNDVYEYLNTSALIKSRMRWGNAGGAMRYTYSLGNNFDFNIASSLSYYAYALNGYNDEASFRLNSDILQWNTRAEFNKTFLGNKLNSGFEFTRYTLNPNRFSVESGSEVLNEKQQYNAHIYTPYFQVDWKALGHWLLNTGVRVPIFNQLEPAVSSELPDGTTKTYSASDVVYSHFNVEPRINLTYQFNDSMSIRGSWSLSSQALHQIPVGSVSLPTDFWITASSSLKPSTANQFTLGWFANYPLLGIEYSVEAYYRKMAGLVELNMIYFNNPSAENLMRNLFTGNGYASGVEFYIKKKTTRYMAWISYAYARSFRHFSDIQVNDFRAKYDRPHDIKLVQMYTLSPRWTISAVWVYASGNTLSIPKGRYLIQGNIMNDYGDMNNYRLPAYHRLDVSATRSLACWGYKSEINFSIYNLYNRANPYFYYYKVKGHPENYYLRVQLRKVSLFPILPSISFKIFF